LLITIILLKFDDLIRNYYEKTITVFNIVNIVNTLIDYTLPLNTDEESLFYFIYLIYLYIYFIYFR